MKFKPINRFRSTRARAFISFLLLSVALPVSAADLYWEGVATTQSTYELWNTTTPWDISADGTGGNVGALVPGASDTAYFNTTAVNGTRGSRLNVSQAVGGLVFNNTGSTTINSQLGGAGNRKSLTIGAGGVTINPGTGAVNFGAGARCVTVSLAASQTWTNNSSNTLTHVANTDDNPNLQLGAHTLTIDGTGNTTLASSTMQGTNATAVIKNGTGVLTFKVTDDNLTGNPYASFTGDVNINGGTVRYGIASALPSTADVIFNTASGTATLELNNFSGTIASLSFGGASGTDADVTTGTGTLTLGGNVTYDATNNPNGATIGGLLDLGAATRTFTVGDSAAATTDLEVAAIISGSNGLIKSDAGTCLLSGANTYTGTTTVNAGTLAVNGSSINDSAQLTIDGGTVELTGAETISALFFGAVPQAAGTWGSSSSAAVPPFVDDTRFTGTGTLIVSPSSGYAAWQSANGTLQAANLDHDNDGVSNGVEHFIFGTANSTGNSNPLPGVDVGPLSVTWTKAATYTGSYGTGFVVETSATLSDPWTTEIEDPNPGFTVTFPSANEVKYTFPAGTRNFARLKVMATP